MHLRILVAICVMALALKCDQLPQVAASSGRGDAHVQIPVGSRERKHLSALTAIAPVRAMYGAASPVRGLVSSSAAGLDDVGHFAPSDRWPRETVDPSTLSSPECFAGSCAAVPQAAIR